MQVIGAWLAGRANRSEVQHCVFRLSDALMDEIGPIDLGGEVLPQDQEAWELAADLDLLQAGFASSLLWKLNGEGRSSREDTLDEIQRVLPKARALNLDKTVGRLQEIARALHSMR